MITAHQLKKRRHLGMSGYRFLGRSQALWLMRIGLCEV